MMNLNYLSTNTITCIARGSTSLVQEYEYAPEGWCRRYRAKIAYPNKYGVSIIGYPQDGHVYFWDVTLLEDGKPLVEDDGYDYTWSDLTSEEEIIRICDNIYFR